MLSTPVRSCYVSRTRLPGAFVQSFGLVRHPETNDVWWIPEGITQSEKEAAPDKSAGGLQSSQPASNSDETAESSQAAAVQAAPAATESKEVGPAKGQKVYRYPSHVLARHDLLKGFFTPGSRHKGGHFRLASAPQVSALARSAIWREDMDTVVLNLSRQQIMADLLHLSKLCEDQGRAYLIKVHDPNETGRYVRRWCFLWFGEENHTPDAEPQNSATGA